MSIKINFSDTPNSVNKKLIEFLERNMEKMTRKRIIFKFKVVDSNDKSKGDKLPSLKHKTQSIYGSKKIINYIKSHYSDIVKRENDKKNNPSDMMDMLIKQQHDEYKKEQNGENKEDDDMDNAAKRAKEMSKMYQQRGTVNPSKGASTNRKNVVKGVMNTSKLTEDEKMLMSKNDVTFEMDDGIEDFDEWN